MKAAKPDDDEVVIRQDKEPSTGACFSAALANDLTAHRTAALRALLADRPAVALAAVVHALAGQVFYAASSDNSLLALRLDVPYLGAASDDENPAIKASAQQRAVWQGQLPEDEERLWGWLLTQTSDTLTGLLAYCVASTVRPKSIPAADHLAAALSLNMAQWWQPTVTGYFGRVAKPQILEAVTEGKGRAAADNIATLKKGDMATRAAELLKDTGWLPAMLKAA